MIKLIENIPSPDILMNSMRSMGYSFGSALADIIDNSISAKCSNVWINFPISNMEDSYLSILDDGIGMNSNELLNAMKYGSSHSNYGANDLGRFGLGLKSASLSQCRCLTVISKKDGEINALRWDLDEVIKTKQWNCIELDEKSINECESIDLLLKLNSGTLVIWTKFDLLEKKSDGYVNDYLSQEVEDAEKLITLVFHRFLNKKTNGLNIYINNRKLIGLDPFLECSSNPKNDLKKPSEMEFPLDNGSKAIINIQACILPHMNDLTDKDIESLGGLDFMKDNQGFYVYRNQRLIVYGTWFRLSIKNLSPELLRYGRVKVDIPNSLDDLWEIDIKKQNANIPKSILNILKKSVRDVCRGSESKSSKRAKLNYDGDPNKIWAKNKEREGKDTFYINPRSNFISKFLEEFDDKEQKKIIRLLNVVSSCIPFDDIYTSVCNKKNPNEINDNQRMDIIVSGIDQAKLIMQLRKCTLDFALSLMSLYAPFDNKEIIEEIRARMEGE